MRIAWFANIDFQEGNASNSRIRAFANGLKNKGNQVFLFFLSSTVFNSNRINKKNKGFFDGIYFNYLSGTAHRSNYRFFRFFNYLIAVIASLILLIKKRKHFDIVYIYQPRLLFFGHIFLLTKILKIPLVIELTELDEKTKAKSLFSFLIIKSNVFNAYLYKYFCKNIIVISEKLKKHLSKFYPESKIILIPIIVDFKRFEKINGFEHKKFAIGYLGSFSSKDGVNQIIESYKNASEKVKGLKLKLIGFNPYKKQTNRFLKSLNLNGEVEKTGQITYDKVPQWLEKCDLLIMNRTNHSFSHYGFPTKLGEYLATGIPTICTKVGDIEMYLTHAENSYLIEPDNPMQLSEAIIKRYEKYELFNKIGQQGKLVAHKHFDYIKNVEILQNVLEQSLLN
ncbi:MAG: glycosyltransferase [Bacteroidetes bacterium]|nr:glycosyltransferase [Bacteroidota bacterium]